MPDHQQIEGPLGTGDARRPVVSVVMANYNGARHLSGAMHSVLAQTVADLELLFADDASSDDSVRLAAEIGARDPRVKVLRSDVNAGPAATRNRALDAARGTWVAIVDSDDLLHPERFERLLAVARSFDADAIADDLIHFSEDPSGDVEGTLLGDTGMTEPAQVTPAMMLGGGSTGPLGYLKPLLCREKLGNLRYREDIRIGEDHDFYMRFLLGGGKMVLTPDSYYLYRRHPGSISHRLTAQDLETMIRVQDDLEPLMSVTDREVALRRRRGMKRRQRFEACVADIKSRRLVPVLGHFARDPGSALAVAQLTIRKLKTRDSGISVGPDPDGDVLLAPEGIPLPKGIAPNARHLTIPARHEAWTGRDWARVTAATQDPATRVVATGASGLFALGYVSSPHRTLLTREEDGWPDGTQHLLESGHAVIADHPATPDAPQAAAAHRSVALVTVPETKPDAHKGDLPMSHDSPLVHVRTPTYKRPGALRRCLESLIAQTHGNWLCDVYDDDPQGSSRAVIEAIADPRIMFHQNTPQRFASRNIDSCFTRNNPHGADYFCVVEDDNYLLPEFMERNIAACRRENVEIVLRNQLVEHASGTSEARLSEKGILDEHMNEGRYAPEMFKLSLLAGIGVSNGGLFWSRKAASDLEIHSPCSATLQEYMRTFAIEEPIHVALSPLAVWAENGEDTQRDHGLEVGYFFRELALKHSVIVLQRRAWQAARSEVRAGFLAHSAFRYSQASMARGLLKSHIRFGAAKALRWKEAARLAFRGGMIRLVGRPEPGLRSFLAARSGSERA